MPCLMHERKHHQPEERQLTLPCLISVPMASTCSVKGTRSAACGWGRNWNCPKEGTYLQALEGRREECVTNGVKRQRGGG